MLVQSNRDVSLRELFGLGGETTSSKGQIDGRDEPEGERKADWFEPRSSTPTATVGTDRIKEIQILLSLEGYDPGPPDGVAGGRTSSAIRSFERDNGMKVTGQVSDRLYRVITGKEVAGVEETNAFETEPLPATPTASVGTERIKEIQILLLLEGYDTGPPDGIAGGRTSTAIRKYEQDNGMKVTGQASERLHRKLTGQGVAGLEDTGRSSSGAASFNVDSKDTKENDGPSPDTSQISLSELFRLGGDPDRSAVGSSDGNDNSSAPATAFSIATPSDGTSERDDSQQQSAASENRSTGHRTINYSDGSRYVGDVVNGKRHGRGEMFFASGEHYDGEWQNNRQHGRGSVTFPGGGSYDGFHADGKFEGQGELRLADGTVVSGNFSQGHLNGEGVVRHADGMIRQGRFVEGKLNGHGEISMPGGAHYIGEFTEDRMTGHGIMTLSDGRITERRFDSGTNSGYAVITWPEGDRYEGQVDDSGARHGDGTYYYPGGNRFVGVYRNNDRHGYGTYWFANGNWCAGVFEHDRLVGWSTGIANGRTMKCRHQFGEFVFFD